MKLINKKLICILLMAFGIFLSKESKSQCSSAVSVDDSLALLDFYIDFDGANWTNNDGWATNAPVADWHGVEVEDVSGECRVTALYLNNNNLTGTLQADLNLTALDSLELPFNAISGPIPDFLNLPSLKTMRFHYCEITGSLPDFSNVPLLEHFELRANQASGSIPDFSNLPALRWFNVPDNNLTGTIPDFTSLPSIEVLGLDENLLTGPIPDFSNIPSLEVLATEFMPTMSDAIPDFTNLPNLTGLFLYDCAHTGSLPDFTNLPNLVNLRVYGNNLGGIIPDFSNLPLLEDLQVCDNDFWGPKPSLVNCPLLDPATIDFECSYCSVISGFVYRDENSDCFLDAGESIVAGVEVLLNGGEQISITDNNGYYEFFALLGNNEITIVLPDDLWSISCDDTLSTDLVDCALPLPTFDFGLTAINPCPQPTVNVSTSGLIPCEQGVFLVDYCNLGNENMETAYIRVGLEPELSMIGSDIPFTVVDNKFEFQVGTIASNACNQFTFIAQVDCTAPLGSTACVDAEILPTETCNYEPGINWDGSDIELSSVCIDDTVIFMIENIGDDMSDTAVYKIYEEDVLIGAFPFQLASDVEMQYIHPNTVSAQAIRIEVEQRPGHPSLDNPRNVAELCGSTPYSLGYVTSTPLNDLDPHRDTECNIIGASLTTNEKTMQPTGVGLNKIIEPDWKIEYKLVFENELPYSVNNVYIVDTIDTDQLDIHSITVEASSHSYSMYIFEESIVAFIFDNILLQDQSADISARTGYVVYSFDQKDTNLSGDLVGSNAEITMGYNLKQFSEPDSLLIGDLPESCNSNGLIQTEACNSVEVNGIEYTMDGNYIQTAVNADGCDSLISVIVDIEYINTNVNIENETTLTAESESGFYSWMNCDTEETIMGETGQSFTPIESGNYALLIENDDCIEMSECQMIIISSVEDFSSEINVYPTMVSSFLHIEIDNSLDIEEIGLINAYGQVVYQDTQVSSIDMTDFSSGAYYMNIRLKDNRKHLVKIFKQ